MTCYIEIETSGLSEVIFKLLMELQSSYTLPPDVTTDFYGRLPIFFINITGQAGQALCRHMQKENILARHVWLCSQ